MTWRHWSKVLVSAISISALLLLGSRPQSLTRSLVSNTSPPHRLSWLAAGDSYASGQGLPYASGPCTRAPYVNSKERGTWAANANHHLGPSVIGIFTLAACTGAKTSEFFNPQNGHPAEWTSPDPKYDLVTLGFGGDNLGFASVIMDCLGVSPAGRVAAEAALAHVGGAYEAWVHSPIVHCPSNTKIRNLVKENIGSGTQSPYGEFLTQVANQAVNPGGNIVVFGYPEIMEDPKFWPLYATTLGMCMGIRPSDAMELRGLAGDLNATIAEDVKAVNATHPNGVTLTYVDVNTGNPKMGIPYSDPNLFEPNTGARHNLCAAKEWLNGLTLSRTASTSSTLVNTDVTDTHSFHPNQEGNNAMAALFEQVFPKLNWSGLRLMNLLNQLAPGMQHDIVSIPGGFEAATFDQAGHIDFWKSTATGSWQRVGTSTYPMLPPEFGAPDVTVEGTLLTSMTDATFVAHGNFSGDGTGNAVAFTNGPKGWGVIAPGANNTLVATGRPSTDNTTPGNSFAETFNQGLLETTQQNYDFWAAIGSTFSLVTDWRWDGTHFVDAHDNVFRAKLVAAPNPAASPLPENTCPSSPSDGTYTAYYAGPPQEAQAGNIQVSITQNLAGEGQGVGICTFSVSGSMPVALKVTTNSGAQEWITVPAWLLIDPVFVGLPGLGLPGTVNFGSSYYAYGESPFFIPGSLHVRALSQRIDNMYKLIVTIRSGTLLGLALD